VTQNELSSGRTQVCNEQDRSFRLGICSWFFCSIHQQLTEAKSNALPFLICVNRSQLCHCIVCANGSQLCHCSPIPLTEQVTPHYLPPIKVEGVIYVQETLPSFDRCADPHLSYWAVYYLLLSPASATQHFRTSENLLTPACCGIHLSNV